MILSKIIYNLKNLQNGGITSDDYKLTNRQIEFIVDYYRAMLANQKAAAGKPISGFEQTIYSVDLEKSPVLSSPDGTVVLRSKVKIPTPISLPDSDGITFVGLKDDYLPFLRTTFELSNLERYRRYTANTNRWYFKDGYIFVVTPDLTALDDVMVTLVAESPRDVINFNKTNKELYYDWEYPFPSNWMAQMQNLFLSSETRALSIPKDDINDGNDIK